MGLLDTNVIVSGLLFGDSVPGRILSACLDQERFRLVTSPAILNEVEGVLGRPGLARRHRLTAREVLEFVARLARVSILVEGLVEVEVVTQDPSDNMFLAAAIEAGAQYVEGTATCWRSAHTRESRCLRPGVSSSFFLPPASEF